MSDEGAANASLPLPKNIRGVSTMSDIPVGEQLKMVDGYEKWSPVELAAYLSKFGLGQYSEIIIKHNITGKLSTYLTDSDLKEMGIDVIGDRLMFKHQIKRLQHKERFERRTKTVWEGKEPLYWSWFDEMIHTCCGIFPDDPSRYKLTTSHLKIKQVDQFRMCGAKLFSCCCTSYTVNNIDLTQVEDVDIAGSPPPLLCVLCCAKGREEVVVQANNEVEIIKLPTGEGDLAQQLILNQVEENQIIMNQKYKI